MILHFTVQFMNYLMNNAHWHQQNILLEGSHLNIDIDIINI